MPIITHITSAENAVGIVSSGKITGVDGTNPKERFPHFFPMGREVEIDIPAPPQIALIFDAKMPEVEYADNSSFVGVDRLVRFLDEYILLPGPTPLVLRNFEERNEFRVSKKHRRILKNAVDNRSPIFAADGFIPRVSRNYEGIVGRFIKKLLG